MLAFFAFSGALHSHTTETAHLALIDFQVCKVFFSAFCAASPMCIFVLMRAPHDCCSGLSKIRCQNREIDLISEDLIAFFRRTALSTGRLYVLYKHGSAVQAGLRGAALRLL